MKIFVPILIFSQVAFAVAGSLSLAVSDLVPRGMTKDEADIITDRLRQEILGTGAFRVMERSMMDEIIKEQSFQKSGNCNTSDCQVQMGRLLGVDRVIVGSTGKLGGLYSVSIRMLNVETGEIELSLSQDHQGAIEGLVQGPLQQLARSLASHKSGEYALTHSQSVSSMQSSRGFAGEGLTWMVRKSPNQNVSIDISNSMLGGLPLRPSSSDPVLWYNHNNGFRYDHITLGEYNAMDQPARKAVLYGRLLHFGAFYASQINSMDTSSIRLAVAQDVLTELDVAQLARGRESRRSDGIVWGAIGMVAGFYTAYFGLLQTDCSTDSYGNEDYCTWEPNGTMISIGGLLFLASGVYMVYKMSVPSLQEREAAARVKAAVERLQQ